MEDSSFKFGVIRDTSMEKSNILTISELCDTNAFLKRLIIYHCCCTMKMVMRNEKIHFHA